MNRPIYLDYNATTPVASEEGDLVTDIEDVDKGKFYTAGAKNALAIIPQAALS